MTLLMLAAVLLQDPDRSTPEKTVDGLIEVMRDVRKQGMEFLARVGTLEELFDAAGTDTLKAARAKQREEIKKHADTQKMEWTTTRGAVSPEKDGVVVVEILEKTAWKDAKGKEQENATTQKLHLVKSGSLWLVKEMRKDCWRCNKTGTCGLCKGEGGADCAVCKGAKKCTNCAGKAYTDEATPTFRLGMWPEKDPVYATGRATAKEAAASFADIYLRNDVELSRTVAEFLEKLLKRWGVLFTPEVAKAQQESLAAAKKEGRQRFTEGRPKVEVEEKGNEAVVLITEAPMKGLESGIRHRWIFKKVGDQWLGDREQRECWCQGKQKECGGCKGSGWAEK